MDKLLRKLISPVAVSGRESAVSEIIAELAAPFCELARDRMGNLVVHKPGYGRRVMVAAHMDSIGVMVTYIDDKGFARFASLGGMRLVPMIGQRVIFENGVVGVICAERGIEVKDLKPEHLYIDTAGQTVAVGDTAAYCGEPVFAGKKVISPYLDNRLGCAVALRALELLRDTENELFFVFTVQEEVGCRGARPAAFTIQPDLAFAVDICDVPDVPCKKKPNALTLEGGPVIKLMDANVIAHPEAVSVLEQAGEDLGIRTQRLVTDAGGTDAGAIIGSRGGVPTGSLAIPIRYTHCPNELGDLEVAENCARLLAEAVCR